MRREIEVGFGDLAEGLRRIITAQHEADLRAVRGAMLRVGERIVVEVQEITEKDDHVHTRAFIDGFVVVPTPDGAMVGNEVSYAGALEVGLPPGHTPDYNDLYAWVLFKWVARGKITEDEAPRVTAAIQRNIHDRGLPPRGIMLRAIEDGGNGMPDSGWFGPSDWIRSAARKVLPARDVVLP